MVEAGGHLTWGELLRQASRRLSEAGIPSAGIEARRIVEEVTGTSGGEYLLELDRAASHRGVARFDALLARREAGEPLQYVLGRWGFRSLELLVDARVLIPRPETEAVVEEALRELDAACRGGTAEPPLQVVEVGTGSGAIALSIAVERREAQVWAVERSADAAAVARANLAGIGRAATRVRIVEGSWFDPLPAELRGRCALVISNPPYVGADEQLPAEVGEWEPAEALVSGPTGFEAIEEVVAEALEWLAPGCALVVELAPRHAVDAVELALRCRYAVAELREDLAGRPRMLVARAPR